MKPMNSQEREALLKELQRTLDWYKGIKHEKPRKEKGVEIMGRVQLSRYQKEVVSKMDNGLFLWTNEGNNFRAWLGDESGKFVERVRIPTATFLFNNKVIEFVDGDYPIRLYKYQLKNK